MKKIALLFLCINFVFTGCLGGSGGLKENQTSTLEDGERSQEQRIQQAQKEELNEELLDTSRDNDSIASVTEGARESIQNSEERFLLCRRRRGDWRFELL